MTVFCPWRLIGGLVLLAAVGCSASAPVERSTIDGAAYVQGLMRNDNGLALRQWDPVVDEPDAVGSTVLGYADPWRLDAERSGQLQRNGFRLLRLPAEAVEPLRQALDGTSMNVDAWYGQVLDWRDVIQADVAPGGEAIAVDGRVRRYEGGRFELSMRSWTVQMEDGPHLHLEVIPQYRSPQARALRLLETGPDVLPTRFASMALDLQLEVGYAYVLFGAAPAARWEPALVEPVLPSAGAESGPPEPAEEEGEAPDEDPRPAAE